MNKKTRQVAIIGTGNLLMGDEGFGIHVIRFLENNFSVPENVRLVDCGTAGIYMAPVFEEADMAVVIDAAEIAGHDAGSMVLMHHKKMRGRDILSSMTPHQIGILEVLEICRLRNRLPDVIDFFLIVPDRIEPGTELSETVAPKVQEMAIAIVEWLAQKGIKT